MSEEKKISSNASEDQADGKDLRREVEAVLRLVPGGGLLSVRIAQAMGTLLDKIESMDDAISELYRDRV